MRFIYLILFVGSVATGCKKKADTQISIQDSSANPVSNVDTLVSDSTWLDECPSIDSLLPKFKYTNLHNFNFDTLDREIDSNYLIPLNELEFTCLFQHTRQLNTFDKYGNKYYFYSTLIPRGSYYSLIIAAHLNELFKGFELIHLDHNQMVIDQVSLLAEGGEAAGWVRSTGGFTSDSTFQSIWQRGWEDMNTDSLGRDSIVTNLLFLKDGRIEKHRADYSWKIKNNW